MLSPKNIDVSNFSFFVTQNESVPGPLPLGVAVIDSSVQLFGLVFPRVAHKHRLQMLQHFSDCIKSSKSARQQAVQINIFTAVLCGLKVRKCSFHVTVQTTSTQYYIRVLRVLCSYQALADTKTGFGNIEVRKAAVQLVLVRLFISKS